MNRRLIVAVCLFLAAVLWWRLDIKSLQAAIEGQTARLSGSRLIAREVSLSLIHGVGLRLDQVSLNNPLLSMQAGHINIGIHLLPLLLGKIEVGTLDIHDATLKLDGDAAANLSASFASLPFERVHLIRSSIEDMRGISKLENIELDVRNIGPDREMLWEISSRQSDYSLHGHGQMAFRAGTVMSGFGKLKLTSIPASLLSVVAPTMLSDWFAGQSQRLSGGLTLDITRQRGWSLFGEVDAGGDEQHQPVRLRGKLSHPAAGELVWHDSFVHLDDRAVIALDGHCSQGQCESHLDARSMPVAAWLRLFPDAVDLPKTLAGKSRLEAMLRWHGDQWEASGSVRLNDASFSYRQQSRPLPALQLTVSELHGERNGWGGRAVITFPGIASEILLQADSSSAARVKHQPPSQSLLLTLASTKLADGVWQPFGNLLLSSLNIAPDLTGSGTMRAAVELQLQPQHSSLQLDLGADEARVAYAGQWEKPAGVVALCHGKVGWRSMISQPDGVQLDRCRVADAQLDTLAYHQKEKRESLALSGLTLDLDKLAERKLLLPDWLRLYHGRIEGSGQFDWLDGSGLLKRASGDWNLQQAGTFDWQLSGRVKVADGIFASDHLQLSGPLGQAELKGRFRATDRSGTINVLSGHLDWQALPGLPAGMADIHLAGHIAQGYVTALGYEWQGMSADYFMDQGHLVLKQGVVPFAGGQLQVDELMLTPVASSLRLDGKIRAKEVKLEQLPWLAEWLQADLSGKLGANIEVKGLFNQDGAVADMSAWQRSNGDLVVYSGSWLPRDSALRGLSAPGDFRKLQLRFRLQEQGVDIPSVELVRHGIRYRGQAAIAADGAISGGLKGGGAVTLQGQWPYPQWQPHLQ
ncbi:glutamyl-tRNA amidotransferase [Mariprofundus erugo]|uniref:glutamyl-tRNA amidotransferase n=1 Tax=Mariprofundus erugo TaxID=2528639 RepID=UPI0010FE4A23|nr:glutamyl-tRNA amidotransferase [Mariprofundus erugo]TLS76532.1 glutamyl-tRNA amidotransferase [Mariprofundus erugo]